MIANINCDGLFIHFLWATLSRDILGSNNVVRLSNCPSLCERVQFLRVSVNSGNAMSVQAGTLSGAHTHSGVIPNPAKKKKAQNLSDTDILLKSRYLLTVYTRKVLETAFFSDEKIFKIYRLYNSQNDGVYAPKTRRNDIST